MTARQEYLMKLSLTCQLADERAQAHPEDRLAQTFAEGVRLHLLDALDLPEGHEFFKEGAAGGSFALTSAKTVLPETGS
jgi:hypothetical protein